MINRKFINFKTYGGFLEKKNEIPLDSIVFIQDRQCIWARGKEYICDGPYTASLSDGVVTFKNGKDSVVFKYTQNGGTIEFEDANGNKSSATYVLYQDFSDSIASLTQSVNRSISDLTLAVNKRVTIDTYNADMANKQEKLYADEGIAMFRDSSQKLKIKSTLDTSVYVIVTSLPDASEANSNKIYLLEVRNLDGTYRYEQYRVRNGQWVSFDMVTPMPDLSPYLTEDEGDFRYQPKGSYLTENDLEPYAKITEDIDPIWNNFYDYATIEYVNSKIHDVGDYVTRDWVINYFVQKTQVYHPDQDDWGTESPSGSQPSETPIVTPSVISNITVDTRLDISSSNPVENRVIAAALSGKVDTATLSGYATTALLSTKANASDLSNYATTNYVDEELSGKQNILRAGSGISIINDEISSTIDTEVYVFVDLLPSTNISSSKIYIVETIDGNDRTYTQWRYDDSIDDWAEIGSVTPTIDLTEYLKSADAASTYQPIGDYETTSHAAETYQPKGSYETTQHASDTYQTKGDYVDTNTLEAFRLNINGTFAKAADVTAAFTILQQIIDARYVLKRDVYNPLNGTTNSWSSVDPTQITLNGQSGGGASGGSINQNMVTLSVSQYEALVNNNAIDELTYYFTYEDEETWAFGGTFPITLS